MKRLILIAALLLAALSAGAQTTIDFTGVSINTARVKKVYERKTFIMATGGPEFFSFQKNHFDATGTLGLRFGMVWHFGFYIGAETGIGGFPAKVQDGYPNDIILNGMRRDPRFSVVAGGIWRITPAVNLYLGGGYATGQKLYQKQDNGWSEFDNFKSPQAELGGIFHAGHLSFMAGAAVIPLDVFCIRLNLGVGYNF